MKKHLGMIFNIDDDLRILAFKQHMHVRYAILREMIACMTRTNRVVAPTTTHTNQEANSNKSNREGGDRLRTHDKLGSCQFEEAIT